MQILFNKHDQLILTKVFLSTNEKKQKNKASTQSFKLHNITTAWMEHDRESLTKYSILITYHFQRHLHIRIGIL